MGRLQEIEFLALVFLSLPPSLPLSLSLSRSLFLSNYKHNGYNLPSITTLQTPKKNYATIQSLLFC